MPAHLTIFARPFATLSALVMCAIATTMAASPAVNAPEQRPSQQARKVAPAEHNTSKSEARDAAAGFIEAALAVEGFEVKRQQYQHDGYRVRKLEVSLINTSDSKPPERIFIIGAHYDPAPGARGATDGGSGTAAVLNLARVLKRIRLSQGTELKFVFFVNDEPRHYGGEGVGSWYRGNFIAFVGTPESAELVRKTLAAFKGSSNSPAEGLVAGSYVEGVTWSGHTSHKQHGYPAIVITDTAFLRYPYYHTAQETTDGPEHQSMARVVEGLAKVIEAITTPTRM